MTATNPQNSVKHMKWWGWGVEGVAFHFDDKPKFAPFVKKAVGLDLTKNNPPKVQDFSQLTIPAAKVSDDLLTQLKGAVGSEYVTSDDEERVVHTYGKSLRDLLRVRASDLPRVPDVVVYPGEEDEVQAIVDLAVAADAVLIPFGGGSNISGSLEPPAAETRTVISLDMGRLSKLIDIDEEAGLARIQAGAQGPDLEEQLNARGWTVGHFPDSFNHSTIGGWVATRSSGMQSDKYGDIADITRGVRVATPGGPLVLRPLPSTSTGPSVREMILGSEGRLGVITEVTAHVHRLPDERVILAYFFPTFDAGLEAMHDISLLDFRPSITRVSDAGETGFTMATAKKSSAGQAILFKVLQRRGWDLDKMCLSFIGYEGTKSHVSRQQAEVKEIVKKHGGIGVGKGPGVLYDQKKFDTPYIRDFLLDWGGAADVSETAGPWSNLKDLYYNTIEAANDAYAELGVDPGWIMCHLSHSYHSGACLYFTFAFAYGDQDPIPMYDKVKGAIQQSFIDNGGTLSHHHAVGTEHSPWLAQDISPAGTKIMKGLFAAVDPGRNFNPGKITG
ncbi:FAD-binding oxidoreductase [Microlunatus soli]|uniref:Alkyldihydroxyacetonephosphate synthase n=1 Tax=Microlunatus soli TaxID=630515 RepID=A0A1H1U7F0_9ACTN|nr:FAD-binding oxidoreductase [Microlunatus soli]SDS68428.1 alkyldihydroxyacetonephosphate synthase [Microlunatus soli]